jgi:lipoprotein-releasing system permease protein
VFNGFEELVKSLYSSFYTDLKISPVAGKTFTLSTGQLKQIAGLPEISGYSLVAEDQAWLQNGDLGSSMVFLKGVDSNYRYVTGVPQKIVKGKFYTGTEDQPAAVLGAEIENALGIEADRSILPLTVYLFKRGNGFAAADPMKSISADNIAASGTFKIQQDFDNKYVITNLAFMKRMLGLQDDEFGGVEISLTEGSLPDQVKLRIQRILGDKYLVQTRYEQNQSLYSVMRVERWVIYAVLTLILAVAAFNMVGALTMLVLEKQKDIQVLKAMGARNTYIQKIFLSEGILLAGLGGGTGIVLAVIICWLQVKYKLVPVKLVAGDFLLVFGTILVVALLASWFPSRKAASQAIELRT